MFEFFSRNKQKHKEEKVESNSQPPEGALSLSLEENVATIQKLFENVDILRQKYITNNHDKSLKFCIFYCDGVVNSAIMNDNIIRPLMISPAPKPGSELIDTLMNEVVQINEMKKTDSLADIIRDITYGDTVLFAEGAAQAILFNTKGFDIRSIDEPDNEKILSGPREGFTESLLANLSLIRRKVRTNELKMKFSSLGKQTQTGICVCYMNNIVNKKILAEVFRRLELIDMDAVLDTNYITELIKDNPLSPFRATGYTERPDIIVGKLLEGRIAIFVDGSPAVLTVPYLFIENFQSNEDYYLHFYYTSFSRLLRIFGFILTLAVPGFYIAIVAFHHEMLPTQLLLNLASERQSVPLPAALEAFVMLIIFDILRETGVRMPSSIGQALSIVGALVIGQAAVEAKLVASPMIIVVASTGITSLLIPKMNAPIIYLRLFVLFMSSTFGLYGLVLGLSAVLIHILNLTSLGIPQLSLTGDLQFQDIKDIFIRAPWWSMRLRPKLLAKNLVRMKTQGGHGHE